MTDLREQPDQQERERKRLDTIWWGGAFVWVGLTLALENLGWLPGIGPGNEWWPWIFLGFGPWSLALNLYRTITDLPNPSTGDWVWTAIFMLVGLGALIDFEGETVGAAVLIVIGLIFLGRALIRPTGRD